MTSSSCGHWPTGSLLAPERWVFPGSLYHQFHLMGGVLAFQEAEVLYIFRQVLGAMAKAWDRTRSATLFPGLPVGVVPLVGFRRIASALE